MTAEASKQAEHVQEIMAMAGERLGLNPSEMTAFCLEWTVRMANASPHYMADAAKVYKEACSPESIEEIPMEDHPLHPFFDRLFSGNPRAAHGLSSNEAGLREISTEHTFLAGTLKSIFNGRENELANISADIHCAHDVIKHCPALRNEAAAMRAFADAEDVLTTFASHIDHR